MAITRDRRVRAHAKVRAKTSVPAASCVTTGNYVEQASTYQKQRQCSHGSKPFLLVLLWHSWLQNNTVVVVITFLLVVVCLCMAIKLLFK